MTSRPDSSGRIGRFLDRKSVILALCIASASAVCLQSLGPLTGDAATFDEPLHIAAAYVTLTTGDFGLNPEHPPLVKHLAALPLLLFDWRMPEQPAVWRNFTKWLYAVRFVYSVNDADRLLLWSRLPIMLSAVSLCLLVFFAARRLVNPLSGVAALVFATFSPTLLAHGHLVTTDLALALLSLAVVLAFHGLVCRINLRRIALLGVLLGLAAMTKFNALLLGPIVLILAAWRTFQKRPLPVRIAKLRRLELSSLRARAFALSAALLVAVALAYGILWAGYGFRFEGTGSSGYAWPFTADRALPSEGVSRVALESARRARVLPEAYLVGLGFSLRNAETRHAFLAGQHSKTGWWYYFPLTILLKTAIPLLLLGCAGLVLASLRCIRGPDRFSHACLIVPPLIFLLAAILSGLNIGHRHVLPVYPFLFIAAGGFTERLLRRGMAARVATLVLSAWFVAESFLIAPHYLAYFNQLAGGPERGWHYLVDSNIDWGQDLKRLARFAAENDIELLYLSYFGTADPTYYGLRYVALPSYYLVEPPARAERPPLARGTWIAVSVTNLQGPYFRDHDIYAWLRGRQPVARIGYSIYVYRL